VNNHDGQDSSEANSAADREADSSRTGRAVSSLIRKEFSERAGACVDGVLRGRVYAGDRAVSNRALGDALGVDESRVRTIRDGRAPWHLGDIFALADVPETRVIAREVLRTMLALVEERSPCVRLEPEIRTLALLERAGELCAVVRKARANDGVIDEEEAQHISHVTLHVLTEANHLVRESLPAPAPLAKANARESLPRPRQAAGGAR